MRKRVLGHPLEKVANGCLALFLLFLIYSAGRSLAAEVSFARYRFEAKRAERENCRREAALAEISRALAAEPANVTFLNEKAYLLLLMAAESPLAGTPEDLEKRLKLADDALSLARQSVAMAPAYWESWHILAVSLKALGMEAESRAAMKRSEELLTGGS